MKTSVVTLRRTAQRWMVGLVCGLACAAGWGAQRATAQQATAQQAVVTVTGRVQDAQGVPVAGAEVELRGAVAKETRTDAAGRFVLEGVSAGDAVVSSAARGMTARVEVGAGKLGEPMLLVLRPAGGAVGEMEFSDAPKFTVAGVTDWTAVGGHGSDVTLRTSESLASATASLRGGGDGGASAAERAIEAEVAADEARGDMAKAQERVHAALKEGGTANLYRLAGEVDERGGDPFTAVREFETAAKLDPSEANEFAWGSELLVHRAIWQAEGVFRRGVESYPGSVRMQTALGAALFAGARYQAAADRLCQASDLAPKDDEPYAFLGKAELAAPDALACVEPHLARYVQMKPESSEAHYLYAMAILKRVEREPDAAAAAQAEGLLKQAVALDAGCGEGYLELGELAAQRKEMTAAIGYYLKAVDAEPKLPDAYFRLAKAYERTGQSEKAKAAFAMHEKVRREQAAAVEEQRKAVKQFLFAQPEDGPKAATP